jgi:hypothetical protein
MAHVLIWIAVLGLLGLWSLASWGLHGLAVWAATSSAEWSGASASIEALVLPAWLAAWVPAEVVQAFAATLTALLPAVEALLAFAPSLAGGITVAAWVLWAMGAGLLLLLGLALSAAVKLFRRGVSRAGAAAHAVSARA